MNSLLALLDLLVRVSRLVIPKTDKAADENTVDPEETKKRIVLIKEWKIKNKKEIGK